MDSVKIRLVGNMNSKHTKNINAGVVFGLLSAVMFSVYAIINRHVFTTYEVDAFNYVVTFSIVTGACGLLATIFNSDKSKFKESNFIQVVGVALLGISALSLFVFAQSQTTATNAAVLSSLVILSTAFWSIPILGIKPVRKAYLWMVAIIVSVYLVISGFNTPSLNSGDIIILIALALFGANNAYSKKLIPEFGAEFIIDFRMVLGAVLLVGYALIANTDLSFIVSNAGLWPVVAGIFSYLTILFTFKAMKHITATNALVLNISHIVITVFGSAIFLNESLTLLKVIGSVAALYSIYRLVNLK